MLSVHLELARSAREALDLYLMAFSGEASGLSALREQLRDAPATIFDRANMRGHITTSMLVFDAQLAHVLLIQHKALGGWLQPGGHYEDPGSLADSAAREVLEETGVGDIRALALGGLLTVVDIDTHAIPARPSKGEGDHFHHDFLFLGLAQGCTDLSAQEEEVSGVRWAPVAELATMSNSRFQRISDKLVRYRLTPTSIVYSPGHGSRRAAP